MTIGVELLEHSPSQVTVKAELVKMAANLTVSVLEAEGVFEKGKLNRRVLCFCDSLMQLWSLSIKPCARWGNGEAPLFQWLMESTLNS